MFVFVLFVYVTTRCPRYSLRRNIIIIMPNTHRRPRRDETVLSRRRRRCEHEVATSWRQFRRVVGVNTRRSRDPVYNFLC